MAIIHLKTAAPRPTVEYNDIRDIVSIMLANIESQGEAAIRDYAEKFDGWSVLMTITTAEVASVAHITGVSSTRPDVGIPDATVFAMDLCGAELILNRGDVQGIAALAKGVIGGKLAGILVGPGDSHVAEPDGTAARIAWKRPRKLRIIAPAHRCRSMPRLWTGG